MSLRFVRTEIPGVIIVEPQVHRDTRGFFLETFHAEKYRAGGTHSWRKFAAESTAPT